MKNKIKEKKEYKIPCIQVTLLRNEFSIAAGSAIVKPLPMPEGAYEYWEEEKEVERDVLW